MDPSNRDVTDYGGPFEPIRDTIKSTESKKG